MTERPSESPSSAPLAPRHDGYWDTCDHPTCLAKRIAQVQKVMREMSLHTTHELVEKEASRG